MKKYLAIILSILLAISLFGCNDGELTEKINVDTSNTSETTETFEERETVNVEESEGRVIGEIIDKISPNILVIKFYSREYVDRWGETVHVVTDKIDIWCVRDYVEVIFSVAELPNNDSQCIRIIADGILPFMPVDKPIIYLYPETATECSVRVALDGTLTCTYPDHGEDGWKNFMAYPDGTLIFPDGMEYYALYWEGVQDTEWDMTKGFCVKGEDTAKFLEWALTEQGLTRREANEFIMYWLPRMQDNPYNVISFQTEAYTEVAKLEISPSPDSLLRVFMAYYATDTEIEIQPQEFDGFTRNGFTVVEWGGTEIK